MATTMEEEIMDEIEVNTHQKEWFCGNHYPLDV